ncbi:TPA: sensor histidine kinase [Streptococcus equi subsp. zooepidemicus]|uniref:histidine kinase n=6 Tax=Streptococcus equi TaxID=1336 RepID=C0MD64_STRS7|nr:sensor histidine kinase [Streptococcus equi]HEL1011657.1 sensor histidine kinase [Streptococcus equi subsp. ruminatorum]EQB24070.1 TCS sensor histidine kinase [Streptococcus equi subsp. zooepidemicus SzS31A1]KED05014.1 sensor histidine kinase [Streptococcus equi subsp. ruminatorum CECT 5772]MCD3381997.1 sensor histidine kinase [Streptococcus equi subsp. zooepidemicus]MCD3382723.1 sensor histidine kinase [Streptococcus equi subsp. zooepidemicus]
MFNPYQKNDLLFYVGLVFMIFPFSGVFLYGYPKWTLVASCLFILCYLLLIHIKEQYRKTIWFLWLYLLLYTAIMTCCINGAMIWFFFFSGNLLTWHFEGRFNSLKGYTFMICFLGTVVCSCLRWPDAGLKTMSLVVFSFVLLMTYMTMQLRKKEQLKETIFKQNQEINWLMAENERGRISRDLHDTLGHTFAMMTIKTELALKQLEQSNISQVQNELKDLNQISQDAMKNVRSLVNNLTFRSLSEELEAIREVLELSNVQIIIKQELDNQPLVTILHSTIVMIVRELATNVVKHAKASHCQLHIYRESGKVIIQMEDDGVGFQVEKTDDLHSIKERLLLVDGDVRIESPQAPTRIVVYLNEGVSDETIDC